MGVRAKLMMPLIIFASLAMSCVAVSQTTVTLNLDFDDNCVVGVIHCHSNYSDGLQGIQALAGYAKDRGAKYIVVTDHMEDIGLSRSDLLAYGCNPLSGFFADQEAMLRTLFKNTGVKNYIEDCRKVSSQLQIVVVPGIEVGINTKRDVVYDPAGGSDRDNVVHMLGVGRVTPETVALIDEYLHHEVGMVYRGEGKSIRLDDAQSKIADIMHRSGMATIIAHPYLRDQIHGFHYTVYLNKMQSIDGIEFFNESNLSPDEGDKLPLEVLCSTSTGRNNFVVTAGCDYHGIPGTGGTELFNRQTAIFLEKSWDDYPNYESKCDALASALMKKNKPTVAIANIAENNEWLLSKFYKNSNDVTSSALQALKTGPVFGHAPDECISYFPDGIQNNNPYLRDQGEPPAEVVPQSTVAQANNGSSSQVGDTIIENSQDHWGITVGGMAVGGTDKIIVVIDNTSDVRLRVEFTSGMVFVSLDDLAGVKTQPLVVVQNAYADVAAHQREIIELQTKCGNHSVGAPPRNQLMAYVGYNQVLGNLIDAARNDNKDIQSAVWKYTDEKMWHGNWRRYKNIEISNQSTDDMRLFLSWHDENGWHNTDMNEYWDIDKGKTTFLADDNIRIHADAVRYWALSKSRQGIGWRGDKKNETIDLDIFMGTKHTFNFS